MAKDKPTVAEAKGANARAVAASNDLGCMDCDKDRPFKPVRYRRDYRTGQWELVTWKLLDKWAGHYCPDCQKKRDVAKAKGEAKAEKKKQGILAAIEESAKRRLREKAAKERDFLNAIKHGGRKAAK